jgi:hypothetical protein
LVQVVLKELLVLKDHKVILVLKEHKVIKAQVVLKAV